MPANPKEYTRRRIAAIRARGECPAHTGAAVLPGLKSCGKCRINGKNASLKRQYGITYAQYVSMNIEQQGLCAICGNNEVEGRELSVDHNHDTGVVRKLLCIQCNCMIGNARESIELLDKAKRYLQSYYDIPKDVK